MVHPVVVVPVYKDCDDPCDRISVAHLQTHLGHHRIVIAKPSGLTWGKDRFESVSFPEWCFRSRCGYNQLLLSPEFYRLFDTHSHILIYQLDALVFRDELLYWCEQPYDYIGATFYRSFIEEAEGFIWPYAEIGCCNGGFSLRRVDSFLRHLTSRRTTGVEIMTKLLQGRVQSAYTLWRYRSQMDPRNYRQHESLNEDVYFGLFSKLVPPELRTPNPEVSDRFAVEHAPSELYRRNGQRLPFGCHAWYKSAESLQFWSPYLLDPVNCAFLASNDTTGLSHPTDDFNRQRGRGAVDGFRAEPGSGGVWARRHRDDRRGSDGRECSR